MPRNFSQTSRDRLAANFFIAIPVVALLLVIRHLQTRGEKPANAPGALTP